ncbi:MAG: hypothetical protein ACKVQB_08495 [Bacteroidia bacterium]
MKCYNHHTHDAVGICKHCQKGICMDCVADTGGGLACKDSCRENVESLNRIVDRQVRMYGSSSQAIKMRTLFYIAFAVFFVLMGFQMGQNQILQIAFIAMGVLFLVMSLSTYRQQKK